MTGNLARRPHLGIHDCLLRLVADILDEGVALVVSLPPTVRLRVTGVAVVQFVTVRRDHQLRVTAQDVREALDGGLLALLEVTRVRTPDAAEAVLETRRTGGEARAHVCVVGETSVAAVAPGFAAPDAQGVEGGKWVLGD